MEMFDTHPTNMLIQSPELTWKPKNEHMEDEIPFEKHHVQVSC